MTRVGPTVQPTQVSRFIRARDSRPPTIPPRAIAGQGLGVGEPSILREARRRRAFPARGARSVCHDAATDPPFGRSLAGQRLARAAAAASPSEARGTCRPPRACHIHRCMHSRIPARGKRRPRTPKENAATFSASIIATIKQRIINWHYPPEHRLTEDGLCREFDVSRSPVREALRVLTTNGFVRRMDNRGYAVRQVKLQELKELYDVRLALELFAVEQLVSGGAPGSDIAALAKTWKEGRGHPAMDQGELAKLDSRFHEELARLAGNGLLTQQLQAINERLLIFRMIDFAQADRGEDTCNQHLALLERIAAHYWSGLPPVMPRARTRHYAATSKMGGISSAARSRKHWRALIPAATKRDSWKDSEAAGTTLVSCMAA